MKEKDNKVVVSISVDSFVLDQITWLAKRSGETRSTYINELLLKHIEEVNND